MVVYGKSSQKYPLNARVPQCSILGPTCFLLYIIDLPVDVNCNIAIYADDTTLYSKCDQASDLWQQLVLASELGPNLGDTVDCDKKYLLDFNAGKGLLVRFTDIITLVILIWKWMGLFLRKNYLLRWWGWISLLNWITVLTLSLLPKLPPRKLELDFFYDVSFSWGCSVPYVHAWNTAVMSGIVPLVATSNC